MGHPAEKATNISGDNFSSGDPKTPSVIHHHQSASEPGRSSSPHQHHNQKGILNRLPDYFRDTVDWFIGYVFGFLIQWGWDISSRDQKEIRINAEQVV